MLCGALGVPHRARSGERRNERCRDECVPQGSASGESAAKGVPLPIAINARRTASNSFGDAGFSTAPPIFRPQDSGKAQSAATQPAL
jgi:hypothetical protein